MPSKESKYVTVSIRRDVWEELEKLRAELGYSSLSNLFTYFINLHREHNRLPVMDDEQYNRLYVKISEDLNRLSVKVDELLNRLSVMTSSSGTPASPDKDLNRLSVMVSQSTQPTPPHSTVPSVPPTMARVEDVRKPKKKERVVEWVLKSKIRNVDAYVAAVEKERGAILHNELAKESGEWLCFAREEDVDKKLEELNAKGLTVDDVAKGKDEDAKSMYDCGLIYYNSTDGKWKKL